MEAPDDQVPATVDVWPLLGRLIPGVAGLLLAVLFIRTHRLLVSFSGVTLALHVGLLVGGMALLAAALLPMPSRLRGAIAAALGAVGVLLAVPSLWGMGSWRGLAIVGGICALPGGLLLRSRGGGRGVTRALIASGAALMTAFGR